MFIMMLVLSLSYNVPNQKLPENNRPIPETIVSLCLHEFDI